MDSTYHLRNMYTNSCIRLLEMVFSLENDISIREIQLGKITFSHTSSKDQVKIESLLRKHGFIPCQDQEDILVEQIKRAAIELIIQGYNINSLVRNSDYISERLNQPYEKISKLFSKKTGITLERYIILLKIEKAKEMLSSNEFTVSEIAYMLGYSSVQYLSNQFKKICGIGIKEFRENPSCLARLNLDEL